MNIQNGTEYDSVPLNQESMYTRHALSGQYGVQLGQPHDWYRIRTFFDELSQGRAIACWLVIALKQQMAAFALWVDENTQRREEAGSWTKGLA